MGADRAVAPGPDAEKYGNWRGVYNRLRMWAVDGTWERVFIVLVGQADTDEDLSWVVSGALHDRAGSSPRGRGPPKKGGPRPANRPTTPPAGRSRGGLSSVSTRAQAP
ncbi:hypothetical protein SSP24_00070 [Streptomyces spinoverrucosus]|uniref:Transposase n=1 Tax=Streptomyces spinoverrucosus TaxID=284043 RepID=A0A4Y3V4Z4_9ACTN|nr:hypothetical protein SSP24_00070 [Streptomyces spinoverrucosus]GHB43590.1 hypothetical protein GCM10010397_12520 [Streptomyces spinoverrucosus]